MTGVTGFREEAQLAFWLQGALSHGWKPWSRAAANALRYDGAGVERSIPVSDNAREATD
jgi:hypothetical protein